ncbi:MAG: MmcQ/YjbR family DNA-binding protein [Oscillospiraceae bacterium]
MDYNWLDEYLRAKPGAEHDYKLEWQWDRYMIRGKLFAAVCAPGPEHKTYGGHPLVNLKCEPRRAELYRAEFPDILPGFYCDKRNWIAVQLDGNVPDAVLRELCDQSYELVLAKLPKYVQKELIPTE